MKIRVKSTDLMQLSTIWLAREYEATGFEIKENDTIIDVVFCKREKIGRWYGINLCC